MTQTGFRDGKATVRKLVVKNKMPVDYVIPRFETVSTTYILNGWDIHAATTAKDAKHLAAQPPYPCRIAVLPMVAGSAGHTDKLTFDGYDAQGCEVVEAVYVKATVASATYTSNAYAKIKKITPSNTAGIVPKTTDVNVYISSAIGLPWPCASTGDILSMKNGINYSTSFYRTVGLDETYSVISLAKATVGSTFNILYLSKMQK